MANQEYIFECTKNKRNLALFLIPGKITMTSHNLRDADIWKRDTLGNPKYLENNGLKMFDRVMPALSFSRMFFDAEKERMRMGHSFLLSAIEIDVSNKQSRKKLLFCHSLVIKLKKGGD